MKTRCLLILWAFLPMTGCISLPGGGTNLLVTPIGVVGVHSFAPIQELDRIEAGDSVAASY